MLDRVRGMLLGGALGDALGGPIEFLPIRLIRKRFGAEGITEPQTGPDGVAEITDDTQMTLFTLDSLIRAHQRLRLAPGDARAVVIETLHAGYLRWLWTQRDQVPTARLDGWLLTHRQLHLPRAPGNTCLTALRATSRPDTPPATTTHRINTSKGCGGVMRVAPAALWPGDPSTVFHLAADAAALTHSHPTGFLTAGVFAVVVRQLLHGQDLLAALGAAREILRTWPEHEETERALDNAVALAEPERRRLRRDRPRPRLRPEDIRARLGEGWSAEETLGIAVYVALVAHDVTDGLRLAVNHTGDSDSTGALVGTLLGARDGCAALPAGWLATLELADVIDQLAQDAVTEFGPHPPTGPDWVSRYPPR
jgi:ADP-ribosyl-[dinitrogen reductase] hydrolase